VQPNETIRYAYTADVGGPAKFKIIAEKNSGQTIYHQPEILPWSVLDSELVVFIRTYSRLEFALAGHKVVIPPP
jgi:hypothetical protein